MHLGRGCRSRWRSRRRCRTRHCPGNQLAGRSRRQVGVRPSEHRKGSASTALREVLTYATQLVGLGRVLITCDETKAGACKAIEACGGLLDSVGPADLYIPQRRLFERHAPRLGADKRVERLSNSAVLQLF